MPEIKIDVMFFAESSFGRLNRQIGKRGTQILRACFGEFDRRNQTYGGKNVFKAAAPPPLQPERV